MSFTSPESLSRDSEAVVTITNRYATEFQQMRSSLSEPIDPVIDDILCYRFLKGFKFNVTKAASQLEKMNKWRRENKMSQLRAIAETQTQKDFPHYARLIKYYPHNIDHSHDKKGQPLSIERFGLTNPNPLCKNITLDELMEYHYSHMENKAALAARLTFQTGKIIRLVKIVDLTGMGRQHMSKKGLDYLRHVLQISQEYYPEHLGTIYVVNIPWTFNMLWQIVKPWLNEATLAKIRILPGDFQSVLLENIDADKLPKMFGGECICPEGCVVQIDPDEGLTEIQIPARSQKDITVEIKPSDLSKDGCELSYSIRTKENDIGFQICKSNSSDDNPNKPEPKNILVPHRKFNDQLTEHIVIINESCTLHILFDNTHSYLKSKTILYSIELQPYQPVTNSNGENVDIVASPESENRTIQP